MRKHGNKNGINLSTDYYTMYMLVILTLRTCGHNFMYMYIPEVGDDSVLLILVYS